MGPAALLGLLGHALACLGGQVGRVELGHERVDALHQPSGRGLLQVLGDRDQHNPAAAQQGPNGDMVLHVAGEAVDLVHHNGIDVAVILDAGEQRLELGAVGSSSRLPAVRILVDKIPALIENMPDTRLALGGDRQPFVGLFFGGDSQVDGAAHRLGSSRSGWGSVHDTVVGREEQVGAHRPPAPRRSGPARMVECQAVLERQVFGVLAARPPWRIPEPHPLVGPP
jgi:hypothetical protein